MQPQDDNPNKTNPFTLPIQEPPRNKRRALIIAACVVAVIIVVAGGVVAYFMSQPQPSKDPAVVAARHDEPKSPQAGRFGTAECPVVKTAYTEIAKQVYVVKDDSRVNATDPEVKQQIARISQYLVAEHPGNSFALMSGQRFPGEPNTQYRSYEIVNDVMVELNGLVPQIIVTPTDVQLDLSDGSASITEQAQRDTIAASKIKAMPEAKLVSTLKDIVGRLTNEERDRLEGTGDRLGGVSTDDNNCIEVGYGLVWSEKYGRLIYSAALNVSTVDLDATTGEVLSQNWQTGIMN